MAARYVNPDNVTAQGQYFYTGLLPGSYDTSGAGGGGNVYGAGSGGSAGVSADRTGSDSKKTWDYQSKWQKPAGKSDKDEILDAIAGKGDPEPSAPPDGGEDPPRGRRKGGGRDPYGPTSVGTPGGATTGGMGAPLGTGTGLPGGPGTTPAAAGALKKRDDRNAARRAKRASDKADKEAEIGRTGPPQTYEAHMGSGIPGLPEFRKGIDKIKPITGPSSTTQQGPMPTPGASAIYAQQGTQGMWGAFTASSASRAHSRPRTF
jgi:hypothetical protein